MKFAFIQKNLQAYPLQVACAVLEVSRSGYYAWRDRVPSPRVERRRGLIEKIKVIHEENRQVYGSPRVCRVLAAQGESVCENTVAKVMAEQQIRAKTKKNH